MNEPAIGKRYWPTVVLVFSTAAALAICLLLAGYLYLPKLVTDRLPAAQIRSLGFVDFTGRISRIGLFQTEAGPFVFGHADQPALSIGSVAIDYTPGELRRKKIRRVHISDVTVNGAFGPEGFGLPGLNRATPVRKEAADTSGPDAMPPLADMAVEKIEIRSGMVNLNRSGLPGPPWVASWWTGAGSMFRWNRRTPCSLRKAVWTGAAVRWTPRRCALRPEKRTTR
jgi:hypothetical protein